MYTNYLKDITENLNIVRTYLKDEVNPNSQNMQKMLWKIGQYEQLTLYRAVDEIESILLNWHSGKLLSTALLARSCIENISQYIYMYNECDKFNQSNIDIKTLDDRLMRLLIGNNCKWDDGSNHITPINVLTCMQKTDKYVFDGEQHIQTLYDDLCEIAHPNWSGKYHLYSHLDKDNNLQVTFSPLYGWETGVPHTVCISILVILLLLIDTIKMFEVLKPSLSNRFSELKLDYPQVVVNV